MKYAILFFLLLSGCTDQKVCNIIKGIHIELLRKDDVACDEHGFKEPERDGFAICEEYCNSYAQDYSKVKQMSMGTCICDNEEGRKVSLGYQMLINNKCTLPSDWQKYQ